ncbi:MAG: hypothetical protein FWD19_00590 [Defluviitaleaceae bacterium]|nr:hypothetical protein [Defluviitaleaceae bacterium]
MHMKFLKKAACLHPDEILYPFDEIMRKHGFDAVYSVTEIFGGRTVYVPCARTIFSRCLEEEARKEFNGKNTAFLCEKYGFTERHMRRLMGMG